MNGDARRLPPLAIIVAVAENGVIGRDGRLPWHLPDELQYFKRLTLGHTVVMGRKTWESIGKALPKRRNIVLSRQGVEAPGAIVLPGWEALAALPEDEPPTFVIGGVSLFAEALPQAGDLYLTRVHASPEGDTFLPEISFAEWELQPEKIHHERDERHEYAFTCEHWRRKR